MHPLGYAHPSLETTALESLLLLPPESGQHVEKRLSEMLGRLQTLKGSLSKVNVTSKVWCRRGAEKRTRQERILVPEEKETEQPLASKWCPKAAANTHSTPHSQDIRVIIGLLLVKETKTDRQTEERRKENRE